MQESRAVCERMTAAVRQGNTCLTYVSTALRSRAKAVLGNPSRQNLWVLSRTARLPPALLEAALASTRAQGLDSSLFGYTPHASDAP